MHKALRSTPADFDVFAGHPITYRVAVLGCLGSVLMLVGCGSTTVFQSSFNSNAVGSPPFDESSDRHSRSQWRAWQRCGRLRPA